MAAHPLVSLFLNAQDKANNQVLRIKQTYILIDAAKEESLSLSASHLLSFIPSPHSRSIRSRPQVPYVMH